MSPASPAEPEALGRAYRGVVCDLDGVVRRGSVAVPHAVDQLRALSVPVVYATNNASLTPADVATQLSRLGLDVDEHQVVTSSQAGAAYVAQHADAGSTVLAVGGPGVAAALTEVGMRVVTRHEPGVVAVLQGYGPEVTATDLAHASYAVEAGARWVATNRDATLPTQHGVAPGNGALIAAVALATGTQPVAVGKPEPPLYTLAVGRLGCRPPEVLAIGDRLDTDILGAHAAGVQSLWVLTGVDHLASFASAPGRPSPTFTATDLQALSLPAQRPHRETPDTWVCEPVRLSVDWSAGAVTVAGVGADVRSRNALAAAAVSLLVSGRDEDVAVDVRVRVAHALAEPLR